MSFESERGLKIHAGKTHKKILLASPEKERSVSVQDISLVLSPSLEARDNEESAHSTPEKEDMLGTFKCDYCKYPPREFGSEAQLSIHHSKRHSYKQENIERIHQCPLCQSNFNLTLSIRNNYYTQNDLDMHKRIVNDNPTNSFVTKWDGFF